VGWLALFGAGLVLSARFVLPLVAPFLLGLVIACLIQPAVAWLERFCHLPRWIAAGGVLALFLFAAGVVLALIGFRLWLNLRDFALGSEGERLVAIAERLLRAGAGSLQVLPDSLRRTILAGARELPLRFLGSLQQWLGNLGHLPEWLLFLFLGVLAAYFFCRDRELLGRFLLGLTPREWRARALGMRNELWSALVGFVRAQFLLVGLTWCLGTLGLAVLGVERSWLLGALLGLLDFLPTVGPGAILLPWSGVCLVTGQPGRGIGLAVVFLILAAARELAEARLIGRKLRLHPLAVLAAIYVGMRLYGLAGFLLGPIILVILRALYTALALPGGVESGLSMPARGRI